MKISNWLFLDNKWDTLQMLFEYLNNQELFMQDCFNNCGDDLQASLAVHFLDVAHFSNGNS